MKRNSTNHHSHTILSLILALTMALSLAIPALASDRVTQSLPAPKSTVEVVETGVSLAGTAVGTAVSLPVTLAKAAASALSMRGTNA